MYKPVHFTHIVLNLPLISKTHFVQKLRGEQSSSARVNQHWKAVTIGKLYFSRKT